MADVYSQANYCRPRFAHPPAEISKQIEENKINPTRGVSTVTHVGTFSRIFMNLPQKSNDIENIDKKWTEKTRKGSLVSLLSHYVTFSRPISTCCQSYVA